MSAAAAVVFYQQVWPLLAMMLVWLFGTAGCVLIQRTLRRMRGGKRRI